MSRIHSVLVRLLPRRFRTRYRDEMREMLAARRAELAGAPPLRRAFFWAGEMADLLLTFARQWSHRAATIAGFDRAVSPAGSDRPGSPARFDPGSGLARPLTAPFTDPRSTRLGLSHLSFPERTFEMLTDVMSDLRFAARVLAKQPVFSAAVVLTLALGIGATTAVYTLVDSVVLRPLPFEDADRLVFGYGSFPLNDSASVSPPDYLDYRDRATSFEALAAFTSRLIPVSGGGPGAPEMVSSRAASHELFDVLGVAPSRGRVFRAEETSLGAAPVALISDGFWKRRFGADPAVVGTEMLVNERPTTIVGVLPPGFDLLGAPDLWQPLQFAADDMKVRRFHFLRVVGKLREGVDRPPAQAEIDAIAADLAATYPESNTDWTMRLLPLHQVAVGDVQQPLIFLLGAVAAVLLMVCGNVAVILLARAARRAPEIAVRNALGASSERIVRLLLCESMLLAMAGGALGILLAYRGVDVLIRLSAMALPRVDEIAVDASVLAFCVAVTLGTGLLFGLVPALRATRSEMGTALREHGRIGLRGSRRLRSALVVGQVALSFALLVGAGLMIRSFSAMTRVEPGYAADELVSAFVSLPEARYESIEQRRAFFDELFSRLAAMSTVAAVGGIDIPPLTGGNDTFAYPEGSVPEPGTQGFNAQVRTVTPGYFEAMRIPLSSGREFLASDDDGSSPVVILDEPFAEQMFPQGDAVGKRIVVDLGEPTVAEVVGIVGGILHWGPSIGRYGTMYFSTSQRSGSSLGVVVRASADPAAALDALRTAVAELDPMLPLANASRLSDRLADTVAGPQFRARLMGAFAIAALLLAAGGLYGVLAYFVAERRRDIGVRLALGADRGGVVRLVVRRGMSLVGAGLLLGALAATGVGWAIRGLLFGVSPADPLAFGGVTAVLVTVALLACLLPARRATRVSPLEALRPD